jgi:hypothetical protein
MLASSIRKRVKRGDRAAYASQSTVKEHPHRGGATVHDLLDVEVVV